MGCLTKRIILAMVLLLPACQRFAPAPDTAAAAPVATPELATTYRQLARSAGPVYALNPAASTVRLYVFRGGQAARLGHNHILSVPEFEGYAHIPAQDDPSRAGFDLQVPLASLVVDDPRLRAETGGAFAGERSASDIEGTRRNMLGPRGLDVAQYPFIGFKSVAVAGDWPMLVAEVDISLHGVTRRQLMHLHVQQGPRGILVRGSVVLRQTDFGITPYSLFGGLMAVQDPVVAVFELAGDLMGAN